MQLIKEQCCVYLKYNSGFFFTLIEDVVSLCLCVQASLNKLMETLDQSEPYFVKCIRSNAEKVASASKQCFFR